MTGRSALLIDLENFFLGRETIYYRTHANGTYEFPIDLDSLCSFAEDIAGGNRLVVRRAYANFNDRRPGSGDRTWDYYLQPQPRFLMEQGIEPVQVFRFPGGGNKNAADMRMAMDATMLRQSPSDIGQFILVTGDADFIPLVLELQRTGAEVVLIGVEGSTNAIFQRYCDRFEYFEDLLAARELRRREDHGLDAVREALGRILERSAPVMFAAVKPLLSDELNQPFNPLRFGCESTGEFLRKYAGSLGVTVRRAEHDWEVVPADESASAAVSAADAPDTGPAADGQPADHGDETYAETLRTGVPRCYVVEGADFVRITDRVFEAARDAAGANVAVVHQDLLARVTEACTADGMADAVRKVRDAIFQVFKAGCFVCAVEGPQRGMTDFHWSRPAELAKGMDSARALRHACYQYLTQLLARRLELRGASLRVQVEPMLALLAGPDAPADEAAMIREVVAENA